MTTTTRKKKMAPALDDVLSSWLLDALRRVFGYEDIRNLILKTMVDDDQVSYGKTFGMEHTEKQLDAYLKKITSKPPRQKKYLLFTASNEEYMGETHYQTFIVDYQKKHLWSIDPASVMGKEGIYAAYVATDTIIPFFKKIGWKTSFVRLTNACQMTDDDIFCQTWSLWLQICFIRVLLLDKKSKTITIPSSLLVRYKDLLQFYKGCIAIPEVCKELTTTYQETIKSSPALVEGQKTKKAKDKLINYYLSFDPCGEVMRMNEFDLMTDDQRNNL